MYAEVLYRVFLCPPLPIVKLKVFLKKLSKFYFTIFDVFFLLINNPRSEATMSKKKKIKLKS